MEGPGYQKTRRKILIASSASISGGSYGKVWHDLIKNFSGKALDWCPTINHFACSQQLW